MLTKIVYDKYWRSWFLHDYKASSGEEAKVRLKFTCEKEGAIQPKHKIIVLDILVENTNGGNVCLELYKKIPS